MTSRETLLGLLLLANFPIAFVGIAVGAFMLRRLRTHHCAVWTDLGEPTLIVNNSLRNVLSVNRFVFRRHDVPLGDVVLSRLVRMLRAVNVISLIVFVSFLLVFSL